MIDRNPGPDERSAYLPRKTAYPATANARSESSRGVASSRHVALSGVSRLRLYCVRRSSAPHHVLRVGNAATQSVEMQISPAHSLTKVDSSGCHELCAGTYTRSARCRVPTASNSSWPSSSIFALALAGALSLTQPVGQPRRAEGALAGDDLG